MTAVQNTQVLFVKRPEGSIVPQEVFRLTRSPRPTPAAGQVLVRSLYLSLDPAMRGWMNNTRSYIAPVELGAVMRGSVVAEVVESRADTFKPGDIVVGVIGWQQYAALDAQQLTLLPVPRGMSIPAAFHLLSITGMTAYFGLLDVGRPKAGETVVVSGAAGATGSITAQIAKLHGCRVVGIAGGAEKCRHLTEELGLDAAVDYRSPTFHKDLARATPSYINVFFDNVGGDVLDAVLGRLAKGARIVLCGAISQYNTRKVQGPRNYMTLISQTARMEGFVVFDYEKQYPQAMKELVRWQQEGKIKLSLHIVDGLEQAPDALLMLFNGKNKGKLLVKIAEPSSHAHL
ncbi:oxidoreductase [Syncephalis pseudoplumigaleata]|uniref:Oxidoreductase n=1 Tax=Syncephalis pseudoplumigaleata TaxID=1712513 RepID=A0A4P9YYR9_9FUNG|nr:oxidoreductase [Syncephalis pseudoplumigaleata]|eukprot:RKP25266.1 oxidoreductase [Syncephalis pseudoplumigaleata]